MALLALGLLAVVPAQLHAQDDTSPQDGGDAITRIKTTFDFLTRDENGSGISNESQAESSVDVLANTQTFTYTGTSQFLTVPEGATEMQFRVIGGQGGKTMAENGSNIWFKGGDGADITGRVPVTPGQQVIVFVGQYGGDGDYNRNPGKGGIGSVRNGGRGGGGQNRDGGGGGGSSGLWLNGVRLVIAGAGGGAGGMGFIGVSDDPGGGGSSGKTADSGVNGKGPGAGKGGAGNLRRSIHYLRWLLAGLRRSTSEPPDNPSLLPQPHTTRGNRGYDENLRYSRRVRVSVELVHVSNDKNACRNVEPAENSPYLSLVDHRTS